MDLWSKLAGSPTLRPQTPSVTSSLALERPPIDDVDAMDASCVENNTPPMLDSVIHLHELPQRYAYAYFERDDGVGDVQTPSGHVVVNALPVRPRVVRADAVVWIPVLSSDGLSGHRFELHFEGQRQAHVEAFVDASSVQRMAFVHKSFSKLAREARLIDQNALLEFTQSHAQKLREFLRDLAPTQLYLPIAEVAVGPELGEAPLRPHPRHTNNPLARSAPAVWRRVLEDVHEIWNIALPFCKKHNFSELARTGLL